MDQPKIERMLLLGIRAKNLLFYPGLAEDIEIQDSPEFAEYVRDYVLKNITDRI